MFIYLGHSSSTDYGYLWNIMRYSRVTTWVSVECILASYYRQNFCSSCYLSSSTPTENIPENACKELTWIKKETLVWVCRHLDLKLILRLRWMTVLFVPASNITNQWHYFILIQEWVDYRLSWNPAMYGGQQHLSLETRAIWTPRVVLENS